MIEPLIADYQHEVFDAIVKGNLFRERYLTVAYSFKFSQVTIGKGVGAIMRFLLRLAVP